MRSYDLHISQGDTYSISLNLTTGCNVPIDLTNYQVTGFIQSKLSSSGIYCNLNPEILSPPSSGMIAITLPYTQTSLLPVDIFPYNIQVINTGTNPITIFKALKGYAYIYAI